MTEQMTDGHNDGVTRVSRVVRQPLKKVWSVLLTADGQAALLGEGAALGDKGEEWRAADGTWGVTRSYHPMEEIRFSWHVRDDSPKTWVEVLLTEQGDDSTMIEIRHDHTGVEIDTEKVTDHWTKALERIESDAL
ncbi:MAG: SRPBCC domain-containing protein [Propionibacteriaceae bacterium]|nr:SRPBCC domain-containing protein [Propionibacteriaceae bacterium]